MPLLHPLVEVGERAVEPFLGRPPLRHVLERAEDADDAAVEIAQRHLVRLDPAEVTARPPQPFDDADDGLAGGGDVGVPAHEPVGAELGVVRPRHVAVGLAEQGVGLGTGEGSEHAVASEVARLQVLPEHGVGRRVHQRLEQLLTGLEGVAHRASDPAATRRRGRRDRASRARSLRSRRRHPPSVAPFTARWNVVARTRTRRTEAIAPLHNSVPHKGAGLDDADRSTSDGGAQRGADRRRQTIWHRARGTGTRRHLRERYGAGRRAVRALGGRL